MISTSYVGRRDWLVCLCFYLGLTADSLLLITWVTVSFFRQVRDGREKSVGFYEENLLEVVELVVEHTSHFKWFKISTLTNGFFYYLISFINC